MRKILAALILLAAAATVGAQSPTTPAAMRAPDGASRADGGQLFGTTVTYSDAVTNGQMLLGTCGSDGTFVLRAPCAQDPFAWLQPSTPGSQQTGNINITGKGIFGGNVEVPSGGSVGGTSLTKLIFPSTDGRLEICKGAGCDNTGTIMFGNNGGSSGAELACGTSECLFATGSGAAMRTRLTQFALSQGADTAASVSLATANGSWTSTYRRCDSTSNTVAYTLPASAATSTLFIIKHVAGANPCTVARSSSDTMDGLTTISLPNIGDETWVSDGSNANIAWHIVGGNVWGDAPNADDKETCVTMMNTKNGAQMLSCQMSELLTLSTGGLTTDTTANLLPANSIIDSVEAYVQTALTVTTNWAVGDPTSSARFCSANATLTLGTNEVCMNQWNGALATTLALSPSQASAAKIRITCTGSNPGAGKIRLTSHYRRYASPTSYFDLDRMRARFVREIELKAAA